MMGVELGKYAAAVMWSYAGTLVPLAALVALTWWRGRQVRRQLEEIEARGGQGDG